MALIEISRYVAEVQELRAAWRDMDSANARRVRVLTDLYQDQRELLARLSARVEELEERGRAG